MKLNFAQQAFFSNELNNFAVNGKAYSSRQRIPLTILHVVNEQTKKINTQGAYNLAILDSPSPLSVVKKWSNDWLPNYWICTNAYDYSQLALNGIKNTIYIPLFRHTQLPEKQHVQGWLSEFFSVWVEGLADENSALFLEKILSRLSRVVPNIALCIPESTNINLLNTFIGVKVFSVKLHEQPLIAECDVSLYLPHCASAPLSFLPNHALAQHLNVILPSEGYFLDIAGEHCFHYSPESLDQSETEVVQRLIRLQSSKNTQPNARALEGYLERSQPNLVFELLNKTLDGWQPDSEMHAKWLFSSALQAQFSEKIELSINIYSCIIKGNIESQLTSALVNRANLLMDLGNFDEAQLDLENLLESNPNQVNALAGMGSTLRSKGQLDQAARYYEQAVKLTPSAKYHWKLAFHYLLQGRYEEAWPHFEYRHEALNLRQVNPEKLARWNPHHQTVGSLLILDEQGIGDTLQFLRFVDILHRTTNLKVYFAGKAPTLPVLRHVLPAEQVLNWDRIDALASFDFWTPLMSLPMHMGINSVQNIPKPETDLWKSLPTDRKWANAIHADRKPVIALCWRGNPDFKADKSRSPGLRPLLTLLDMKDLHFVSLQINELAIEEIYSFDIASSIQDLGSIIKEHDGSLLDTFSLLKQCDYLVTSCTSMAHMAGILGIPTSVMLPVNSDWRWLADRPDSPWYPSVNLIRQKQVSHWEQSVAEVKAILTDTFRSR
ncbi:tetratricopeptide repeat protein [Marinomonas ostreistagni]|uniref:Tetratricopeptide repeat protein n=1 Tax=Marinomonas ostreistagni TaxID=359209 RepID=A0ABS0Z936_9GAMM|nr:tetratricopeptide repeat protein [Marinomonas ostreistagni]MBJ7549948.1 tetratricopeptide repeat protein [Marinomonas ostreistagni]